MGNPPVRYVRGPPAWGDGRLRQMLPAALVLMSTSDIHAIAWEFDTDGDRQGQIPAVDIHPVQR